MAQVLLMKIMTGDDGELREHSSTADDVTFQTITATNGPVISGTGIVLNTSDSITLTDATGAMVFALATDAAAQLDQLVLPRISGTPTATPTSGEASTVWDQTNNLLYVWDGAAWSNSFVSAATATSAQNLINTTAYTGAVSLILSDVVFISAANQLNRADANNGSSSIPVGFASASSAGGSLASFQYAGDLAGFSGLTAAGKYFLSEVAGGVTTGVPSTSGAAVYQVGYARNASVMHINLEHIGIRA